MEDANRVIVPGHNKFALARSSNTQTRVGRYKQLGSVKLRVFRNMTEIPYVRSTGQRDTWSFKLGPGVHLDSN